MIPVRIAHEPPDFDRLVRKPGARFLAKIARPTTSDFGTHSYWRRILKELHDAYGGICAYSCHFIPYDTGADTVEHFAPKSRVPRKAYEWANYRLVCQTLNGRKGDYEDVLDPFGIKNGWFTLDFPSLLVKPMKGLRKSLRTQIVDTCDRLGLNDESTCLRSRERYVRDFCTGSVSWDYMLRDAPFIAREVERQGLRETLPSLMRFDGIADPDWPLM